MDVFKEAEWIDPELPHGKDERQPASVLRRSFTMPPAEETDGPARLFITCHGLYEAKINGSRVGDFILAPGCDNYKKRLQYQVYDVSELLRTGENLIEVTLGDGWYRGNVGIDGICNYYGNDLALLCRLDIILAVLLDNTIGNTIGSNCAMFKGMSF